MSGGTAERELVELCDVLESTLSGPARSEIVSSIVGGTDGRGALKRLRGALRAQTFGGLDLSRPVRKLDVRTRRDGFRVLHSWNHQTHDFTKDVTPVLMLDYYERAAVEPGDVRVPVAILLDYYFLHLLSLCAMRAWDAADTDGLLDRVTVMVGALQGEQGSGHQFVDDAETLIIYALSQFHPEEHAYDSLIERFAPLTPSRRLRFAALSAAVLGSHLRWGFWLMYDRDVLRMRRDNVGDYPWLLDSVATLLRAFGARHGGAWDDVDRHAVVDGLLQGLAADPWAFIAKPPPALAPFAELHEEVRGLLKLHGRALLEELEGHRPTKEAYSPLALHFNFPHNTLVALVAMSLLEHQPQPRPLDLLLRRPLEPREVVAAEALARALMAFSGASPDRLGAHGAMLVAYDPLSAMRSFSMTTDAIREVVGEA